MVRKYVRGGVFKGATIFGPKGAGRGRGRKKICTEGAENEEGYKNCPQNTKTFGVEEGREH